jgi:small-conductance mechanosensitive channel
VGQHYTGDVVDITLRHTVIRDFENRKIVIPNSVINNETIIDSTNPDELLCVFVEMSVGYTSDINTVMRIMQEEALQHPFCRDNRTKAKLANGDPQVVVRLIGFSDSGMTLRAYVWAKDPAEGFVMKCDLFKSIKERFDKEGVEIPYPYRTLIMKEGDKKIS